jgi:hypothetical protein
MTTESVPAATQDQEHKLEVVIRTPPGPSTDFPLPVNSPRRRGRDRVRGLELVHNAGWRELNTNTCSSRMSASCW